MELGRRLREVRDKSGDSLRKVESRSGLNNGYLSQLENGKITHPSPSVLEKVARGYELRFEDLLRWTGYVSGPEDPVTPNQAVAFSTVSALGDPSDEELRALKAIVEVLRKSRPMFAAPSDMRMDDEAIASIRAYVRALLREADALGRRPTPLDDIEAAARLVRAGELSLDPRDRARLVERFGHWVNLAWKRLQGACDYRASAIWVAPDLHAMKHRFVVSHEIGHAILPAHKQTFAYVDDFTRLPPIARDLYEREANQAAIEILLQGGQATDEFDSSPPSLDEICSISQSFGASVVATTRYAVETTKRAVAVAIAHVNAQRGLGPTHIYASRRFDATFGWQSGATPWNEVRAALRTAQTRDDESWVVKNLRGEPRIARVQKMSTGYATIVLVIPESRMQTVTRKLGPVGSRAIALAK